MDNDSNLFLQNNQNYKPLAEKLRPVNFHDFIGQENITGKNSLLKKMIEGQNLSSFILWGPPGVGKTTIARIISNSTDANWESLSAVLTSIKDVKQVMEKAKHILSMSGKKTILFIDEIHRFNKAQQDAFLSYVEEGSITLIGATTENPSFSIIPPLLSRVRVIKLEKLTNENIIQLINKAINFLKNEENISISINENNKNKLAKVAGGDARRCYGIIEMLVKYSADNKNISVTSEMIEKILQRRLPSYDKKGDYHYDYISALHKSMRNSDVQAALYYTVKMLESGEDPLYIIRRIIQHSSEDIGMADPQALVISIAARDAVTGLGMPEAKLSILQAVAYNALAPKSNSLLEAYHRIKKDIENNPDISVPMQIRNAPTKLMKETGYGEGYQYAHDYEIPITSMQCLPDELKDQVYYIPKNFGFEKILSERLKKINEIKQKK